jgi:aminoglycoside phosphotransferase (APT) family kinase protein
MTSDVALVGGPTPCVVKRCRDPIYFGWHAREQQVLRALSASGLPIPRLLDYVEHDTGDRREAWLVMSRLEGRPLWSEMRKGGAVERAGLLTRVGALLKRLHQTPAPASFSAEAPWIDRKLAEARQNLAWCDGTVDLLADLHRRRPEPVPEALIHGDLALDNVLLAADGALSLVDWAGADRGDPRNDLALALQTEPEIRLGESEVHAFFDGYGTPPIDRATRKWFEDLYEFF